MRLNLCYEGCVFRVRQRVKLLMPRMTKIRGGRMSRFGTITKINGAYHMVKPDGWPRGTFVALYPCEIKACRVKATGVRT